MIMITEKEYLQRKINIHEFFESDQPYLDMANRVLTEWNNSDLFSNMSEEGRKEVVLCLTGYMQDLSIDLGVWRAFTTECRNLYGMPVPFYMDEMDLEDYIDFELNLPDIKFLVWYSIAFSGYGDYRYLYPLDVEAMQLAKIVYEEFERCYDTLPRIEGMEDTSELDLYDEEDTETITRLGQWLFWNSYLLVPAFKENLHSIVASMAGRPREELVKEMGEAQISCPSGPLALFLREWMWLLVNGKMPTEPRNKKKPEQHPYYEPFLKATGGSRIAFFDNYKKMNIFFSAVFGWDPEQDNLPNLKDSENFTLLVNPEKGMLIARNVAKLIDCPENPYFDSQYAASHTFDILTQKGRCPIDLVTYALKEGYLTGLQWHGVPDSHDLLEKWGDMVARVYLLQYYRAV